MTQNTRQNCVRQRQTIYFIILIITNELDRDKIEVINSILSLD